MATAARTAKTRKRSISSDPKGRYRPYIGEYLDESGTTKPKRFNLGTDRIEAERRYHRLHDLYAEVGGPWRGRTLEYAEAIACGERPKFVARDTDGNFPYCFDFSRPSGYAQAIEDERQIFRSLASDLLPGDPVRFASSIAANQELVAQRVADLTAELQQLRALAAGHAAMPDKLIPGSFHEALDAYRIEFTRNTSKLPCGSMKQGERKRKERVGRFKTLHSDCPLYDLTKDKIEEFVSYWRNRPATKRGNRSSISNAENHLAELFRFLDWLDGSSKYEWVMPKGVKQINRSVEKFEHEKKLVAVTKETYAPEQLAKINATATQRERLALYLALNCGMGAAELGRLVVGDFYLDQPHPYAQRLGLETAATDCYLRYFRPKTEVFGEFCLWPETVEMIRWAAARAREIGTETIFCRDTGRPLYDDAAKKPDAGFANLWTDCRNRSGIDSKLAFGSLRDTLPDYLRATHDAEIASLCLTHGTPGVDQLIDCYSNKPWARFHNAVMAARTFYGPVFAVCDRK